MKTKNVRRRKARRYVLNYPNSIHYRLPTGAVDQWYRTDLKRGIKELRSKRRFKCLDCRVDTSKIGEYYVVHDFIWFSVANKGMLCIGCIERRLGRRLTPFDFKDAQINYIATHQSPRLVDRLTKFGTR